MRCKALRQGRLATAIALALRKLPSVLPLGCASMRLDLRAAYESSQCLTYTVGGPFYRPLQPVVQ